MRAIFACAIAASLIGLAHGQEASPEQQWAAAVKQHEASYAAAPLAILKIDTATYIAPDRRAWLRPTGEANGKLAWADTPGRDSLLQVAATKRTISVRLRGESIAFRWDRLGSLSISDDLDLQFHPVPVRDRVWGVNVFVYNQANPAAAAFKGLSYFPYNSAYRVEAAFTPTTPERVAFLTAEGITKPFWKLGAAQFVLKGAALELPLYGETETASEMSAFFLDGTSGAASFTGGRYLTIKSAAPYPPKTVAIDFNYARSPACARNAFYTCAPSKDRLAVAVEAGEKAPPAGGGSR